MKFAASRLAQVKPSASAWVSQAAKAAIAAGEDVIDLGLGEPDFDTPAHIIEAAHQAALNSETRWIMLNLPSNTAGAVYSNAELRALGAVLAKHPDVLILSDEIYEHILFDGRKFHEIRHAYPASPVG